MDRAEELLCESRIKVHPYVQMCRGVRKRKLNEVASRTRIREQSEAVGAEKQVHPRSSIDCYLLSAKKMRLRRRSKGTECVITGDLKDLQNLWITAQNDKNDPMQSSGNDTVLDLVHVTRVLISTLNNNIMFHRSQNVFCFSVFMLVCKLKFLQWLYVHERVHGEPVYPLFSSQTCVTCYRLVM